MKNKPTLSQFFLGALSITAIGLVIGLFLLSILVGGAKIVKAETVYESSGNAGFVNVNFASCSPYPACQGEQLYVSRSAKIPLNQPFDRVQIQFFNPATPPAMALYVARDTGDSHESCNDQSCVTDDIFYSQRVVTNTLDRGNGIYEYTFDEFTATSSDTYFYISVEPNTPFQNINIQRSTTGYIENGFNLNKQAGGYKFQLCNNLCSPFGTYSESAVFNKYTIINAPQPYGTTTASTTVNLSVTFSSQAGFDSAPSQNAIFRVYDAVTNELELEYLSFFEANTNYTYTYSTTTVLIEGSKIMRATIQDATTGENLAIEKDTFFNVITNSYLASTGLNSPLENPADLSQINCSTFDIGCQFQKAITFLFVPSDTVLNRYSGLWQQIRNKVPFGYVSAIIDQLEGLGDDATPAFDLGELPFMNTLFTPLRDAFGVMLWGIYAIYFYRHRLTQLDI